MQLALSRGEIPAPAPPAKSLSPRVPSPATLPPLESPAPARAGKLLQPLPFPRFCNSKTLSSRVKHGAKRRTSSPIFLFSSFVCSFRANQARLARHSLLSDKV